MTLGTEINSINVRAAAPASTAANAALSSSLSTAPSPHTGNRPDTAPACILRSAQGVYASEARPAETRRNHADAVPWTVVPVLPDGPVLPHLTGRRPHETPATGYPAARAWAASRAPQGEAATGPVHGRERGPVPGRASTGGPWVHGRERGPVPARASTGGPCGGACLIRPVGEWPRSGYVSRSPVAPATVNPVTVPPPSRWKA
ncbi:hypothetical protein GCM10018771_66470 [Streptomyces cellulosae]|nr:hypothetical protein GCM10018771_66470 [Streptomyces cellulosae]